MKCYLHFTLKRDLMNVVWISSGKEFQILAPIYSFKNLKVLWSLFIDAVKYMACGQVFYCF